MSQLYTRTKWVAVDDPDTNVRFICTVTSPDGAVYRASLRRNHIRNRKASYAWHLWLCPENGKAKERFWRNRNWHMGWEQSIATLKRHTRDKLNAIAKGRGI